MPAAGAQAGERHMPKTMREAKVRAVLMDLEEDPSLARALLVFLGTFFLLMGFPFYGPIASLIIAALAGALAYKSAPLGTIVMVVVAFPAVAYQSPLFAWLFGLVIAVTLFEAFEHWSKIAMLAVLIMAPFAAAPFGFLGGIVIPTMTIAALYAGSRMSLRISVPAVFFILLLTTLWGGQNSAFMPVKDPATAYGPLDPFLAHDSRPVVEFAKIPAEIPAAVGSIFSAKAIEGLNPSINRVLVNTFGLLFADSALIQILAWGFTLFMVGYLPARMKGANSQVLSSLSLVVAIGGYYLASGISGQAFNPLIFVFVGATVVIVALLERGHIKVSRERAVMKAEKTGKFGKFGIEDLSTSSGVDSLANVGGYEDLKDELTETIVWPVQRKELAIAYGIKPPKGILLFGPPGTGKTLIMRALAKELDVGFYYIKCSELLSQWYGESEKNISELFTIARKNAPCILFFDEIDAIGKRRDKYSADDVAPRIMSLFLQELDGFASKANVIVIGATNVPNMLDPALLRPGRVDKIIYMPLPDAKAREAIFKVHAGKMPLADDVDFEKLARISERYSGADIANACTEAARQAARTAAKSNVVEPVEMADFVKVLKSLKPSVSLASLEEYEQFKMDFERRSGAVREEQEPEKEERKVKWQDVVGLEDVKQVLLEAIELPLLHEDLMKLYKVRPAKGLLLFGPPGCGKTMIVKAATSELKATFLQISGADMMKNGYEGAVQAIKETFNRAKENTPALIFIDEIEAIAPARGMYASHLTESVVAQLLNELDGVKELKNVMLVGATNKPAMIDSALMRPGRFDKILYIPPPDERARKDILKNALAGLDLMDIDLDSLAQKTEEFSGADIVSICQEARMGLVRAKLKGEERQLSAVQLNEIIGSRRPSITEEQLKEYMAFMRDYGERR
ncbi:MAG: AAA family ATPase [Candidatus Burarchaeum sp.]|nr:AAA family ATPase [Candidatus Burarchaeum sp.]MDO8339616.1 AAA family ATPase [Candidatus Burarchaeum sp.]